MNGILGWIKVVEYLIKGGFLLFLSVAGYQDWKEHKVRVCLFLIFGALGAALRGIQLALELGAMAPMPGTREAWVLAGKRLEDIGMAVMVGGILLAVSVFTREALGRGDGWFFTVSGIYLGAVRNVILLYSGILLCFLVCAVLFMYGVLKGRDVRRQRLPFLPFLIPAGLGVTLL